MAYPRGLAALVGFAHPHVPARGRRAHCGRRGRSEELRTPWGPLRLALGSAHPLRRVALRLRAAAENHLERRPPDAAAEPPALPPGALEAVTRAAFGQRRKMLRQSLKSLTPNPAA